MRHRWQILVLAALWLFPRLIAAQCADEVEAVGALADARKARGVVSDLELMRSWHGDVRRRQDEMTAEHGSLFDKDGEGIRHHSSASWLWWSDSFDGFRLCESNTPVGLDRSWWGAHARFDDTKTGIGYELFFLSASDSLDFPKSVGDVDYGWRHRIAGAELRYRDWAALKLGTIDIQAPARAGDGTHEGSAYLALSLPRFNLGADVLIHPDTRRLDMLQLGLRRTPLGFAASTLSVQGGWLDDETKGLLGIAFTAFDDSLSLETVFEGTPVRLRSLTLRVDSLRQVTFTDDVWMRAGFAPFLEVSAFNGGVFEEATGRSLVPGASTGLRAFFAFEALSTGVEAFVGVNRARELNRLTRVVDHLHWGGRVYLRVGI